MKDQYVYLLINFLSIIFPLLFSFHSLTRFYKKWPYIWPAIIVPAALFILWDICFTAMGVWHFNPRYVTGIYFFNLPIEEVLFFICIPYACAFTYHSVNILIKREVITETTQHFITDALIFGLLVIGTIHYDRWYTFVTFILLATFLIFVRRFWKPKFLGRFYLAFLFILIPFFIVNGVLTGTGLEEPVVSYNNFENLGIRMLTIPVEDTFYGMLLLLLNISLLHVFEKRANAASS